MGAVKINGTTSGSVSLEAPASGSDVTLTLPGTTMNLGTELASKLPIAGGKILQIVRATDNTQRSTTSTSLVDVTGMSVTITPQYNNSAILIVATFLAGIESPANVSSLGFFAITDSSNNGISGAQSFEFGEASNTLETRIRVYQTLVAYATPATTSATTYKLRFRVTSASAQIYVINEQPVGSMYAIEVSA